MKHVVIVVTLALVMSLAGAMPSTTATASSGVGSVYMIGDSMTARSEWQIRKRTSGWKINSVRGRKAVRMVPILRRHKFLGNGPADTVVIALGSNEQRLKFRHYKHAVDMMPESTNVVLVNVFRTPQRFGKHRARRMAKISRWMNRLENRRDNVCVARWRRYAKRNTNRLVLDGVHPTHAGKKVFAKAVKRTVARC